MTPRFLQVLQESLNLEGSKESSMKPDLLQHLYILAALTYTSSLTSTATLPIVTTDWMLAISHLKQCGFMVDSHVWRSLDLTSRLSNCLVSLLAHPSFGEVDICFELGQTLCFITCNRMASASPTEIDSLAPIFFALQGHPLADRLAVSLASNALRVQQSIARRKLWHHLKSPQLLEVASRALEDHTQSMLDACQYVYFLILECPVEKNRSQQLYDMFIKYDIWRPIVLRASNSLDMEVLNFTILLACSTSPQLAAWAKQVAGFVEIWEQEVIKKSLCGALWRAIASGNVDLLVDFLLSDGLNLEEICPVLQFLVDMTKAGWGLDRRELNEALNNLREKLRKDKVEEAQGKADEDDGKLRTSAEDRTNILGAKKGRKLKIVASQLLKELLVPESRGKGD